ncbi:MAG: hypothetical protein WA001_04130 [Patescibacteria group bacterium]
MDLKAWSADAAQKNAESLKQDFTGYQGEAIGVVLGTGWGDCLKLANPRETNFKELVGFGRLGNLAGHARKVLVGPLDVPGLPDHRIVALKGRIHLNEELSAYDPSAISPPVPFLLMVRQQIEMLLALGIRTFVLTAAVGSLPGVDQTKGLTVGGVMAINSLVTLFAPPMPLFAGEFVSPEDVLDEELYGLAVERSYHHPALTVRVGCHAMVRGPQFEGRKNDKRLLALAGAEVVGMSILPELCVIATQPDAKALALCHVTNGPSEEHSHETNLERSKEHASELGMYLTDVLASIVKAM